LQLLGRIILGKRYNTHHSKIKKLLIDRRKVFRLLLYHSMPLGPDKGGLGKAGQARHRTFFGFVFFPFVSFLVFISTGYHSSDFLVGCEAALPN